MKPKNQIPSNFKPYKTYEGKFADHVGPYYIKNRFPKTIFGTFISEKHSNLNNVAHGGFLMAFADSIGGFVAYNTVKKSIVTINLNSCFLRPVNVGSWLEGKGVIKKFGKRLVFVEIELMVDKRTVFTSSGIWQIINIVKV